MSGDTDLTTSAISQSEEYPKLEVALSELRLALIRAIALRAGETIEHISLQETCSETALAELYRSKLRANGFVRLMERLLSRWRH
jgi:hypothetical protein